MSIVMLTAAWVFLATAQTPGIVSGPGIEIGVDADAMPIQITGVSGGVRREWLQGPVFTAARNESTGITGFLTGGDAVAVGAAQKNKSLSIQSRYRLRARSQWRPLERGLAWDLAFTSEGDRSGYEFTLEFPVLGSSLQVFTPTEYGVVDVAAYPELRPAAYGSLGWESGSSYVLPLVTILDPAQDAALTIALPADANIPHLQVDWREGKTLRFVMGHRGVGEVCPTPLTLLFYTHAADYRAALQAYSADYPAYFRPALPRGPHEGAFWYHHIQEHPDFDEMARQQVRYTWMSFWFTHLGEYLPKDPEWEPYTYAKWWKLGQKMSDSRINDYIGRMHERGIGCYAYFNVTEYGGMGGASGDAAEAERILRERFRNALVKDEKMAYIPTWEGAMAMNPGEKYALRRFLDEQVTRHLTRLPAIDGFVIDRLDWACRFDYGHHDGLSYIGKQAVENLAAPIASAVQMVCDKAHKAGKRVLVNQFYRIEVLRDVDGYCHENDYLPALGYLSPFRPAAAWHKCKPYDGDLLQFEGQLKRRLQWALFPQMIAREWPLSQQAPDPEAAQFLEIYAPLFEPLAGKEQVLEPHCIAVSGPNDVNLFINGNGHYVIPITSRIQFLSRNTVRPEPVTVTVRGANAAGLEWAYALRADGPPVTAAITVKDGAAEINVPAHGSATMVVAGKGQAPVGDVELAARLDALRQELFPPPAAVPVAASASAPSAPDAADACFIRITGEHLGIAGNVSVRRGDKSLGSIGEDGNFIADIAGDATAFEAATPGAITLTTGHDGIWFVPTAIELHRRDTEGESQRLASWTGATAPSDTARQVTYVLVSP